MIQLEQQQHGEFVGGWWVVAYTSYLYPARWGWIKKVAANSSGLYSDIFSDLLKQKEATELFSIQIDV